MRITTYPSIIILNVSGLGLPWWSRGEDSMLPIQGAHVQPLVRELGFSMPHSAAKKKKKKNQWTKMLQPKDIEWQIRF